MVESNSEKAGNNCKYDIGVKTTKKKKLIYMYVYIVWLFTVHNVESGLQSNYSGNSTVNPLITAAAAAAVPTTNTTATATTIATSTTTATTTTIDNRSILQPYSIVVDSKNPGYQFINTSYEADKHDVEKAFTNGSGGRRSLPGIKAGFEQAIELCGYGKFHYVLLAICGLVSTSEEMDVISMSFILPSAQCDLNLNTKSKGWLNSIIFIGMMVGAYFWGSIADSVGRKKVLIVISFMNGFCIVASSFSQTFEWFMFFRFLNGAA